jgi:prolyl-tRNA synthetase
LGAGIFSYLHLAQRSITKIENILRDEMNAIGGQEITMPVVHPADIWKETGRWYEIGSEMGRFYDKNHRDMVLAMTHEEVIADLVRTEIQSYKQLPRLLYHIQTKWRDDPRPRAGLIRVREFTMKDSYSLDTDSAGLFMYLTPIGEDTIIRCDKCGYTANRQIARFQKPTPMEEKPKPIQKVATPGVTTIEGLAKFLAVPESRTAKAFFSVATVTEGQEDVEKFVFAVVRGDMDVNETKLANTVGAKSLRPARDDEIRDIGAIPGYASPIMIKDVIVVVDDLIPESPNLVAGANEEGYHLLNVNYGRDYQADIIEDIVVAEDGYACPDCGTAMHSSKGVEVGNIFKLGTRYSEAMGCTFSDKDGQAKPVVMGSYGIGVGRLLACVAEEHHDEHGLSWPITVTPYHVYVVALQGGKEVADRLCADLESANVEVLYDDRDERAGVKFNDADLIGIPIRLTVSKRSLEAGGVEVKLRRSPERTIVSQDEILPHVAGKIEALQAEIADKMVTVPYNA